MSIPTVNNHTAALNIYDTIKDQSVVKNAKCLPGSGWLTAKMIKIRAKDDSAVADKICEKLEKGELTAETLRWFTPEQITLLKEKLAENKDAFPMAPEIFQKAIGLAFNKHHSQNKQDALLLAYGTIQERTTSVATGAIPSSSADAPPPPAPAFTGYTVHNWRDKLSSAPLQAAPTATSTVKPEATGQHPDIAQAAVARALAMKKQATESWQKESPSKRANDSTLPETSPESAGINSNKSEWQQRFRKYLSNTFPAKNDKMSPNLNNVQSLASMITKSPVGKEAFKMCPVHLQLFVLEQLHQSSSEHADTFKSEFIKNLKKETNLAARETKNYIQAHQEDAAFGQLYKAVAEGLSLSKTHIDYTLAQPHRLHIFKVYNLKSCNLSRLKRGPEVP